MPFKTQTPSPRTRRPRAALLSVGTVATALLLGACAPSVPPSFASPLGTLVETSVSSTLALENTFDPTESAIVGPHFALAVGGAQFSKKIDATKATELGLDGPLTAPAGYEVMVMQASPDYDVDAAISERSAAKASLELGDRTVDLVDVPEAGDMIVAMAPEKSDVRLVVTDAGKRFSVNLRSGVHEDFVPALLASPPGVSSFGSAGPYSAEVKAQSDKWIVTFGTYAKFDLNRSGWLPDYEWAADGKLWVQVDFAFQYLWKGSNVDLKWTLDPAKSLSLKVGSATVKATKTDVGKPDGQWIQYKAVFEIDPTVTALSLVFKPSGTLKIVDGSKESKPKITKAPAEKKFAVDFAA